MLHSLIVQYGVLAIFFGAAIEGETAAFLGGIIAHRHLTAFWQVAIAAGSGSFVADQLFFFAGRRAKNLTFVQHAAASPLMARVTTLLDTYPTAFILAFRFIYGMRTISPIAIGLSNVPAKKFLLLNAVAAAIWGISIPAIGYLFGDVVETVLGRLHLHWHLLIGLGFVTLVAITVATCVRRRMMRTEVSTSSH